MDTDSMNQQDEDFIEGRTPIGSFPLDKDNMISGPFTPAPTPILMNQQEEGRIDPADTRKDYVDEAPGGAIGLPPLDIGVEEFARLQGGRIKKGEPVMTQEEFVFPSAEQAALAAENPDTDPRVFGGALLTETGEVDVPEGWSEKYTLDELHGRSPSVIMEDTPGAAEVLEQMPTPVLSDTKDYVDEAPGGSIGLPLSGTKDTNPKDGVGSLKPSYSNVSVPVLYEVGAAMLEGARKYGGYNWRVAGIRTSVYIDAARRHLDAFWEGEDIDDDSGLSHITKAIASLTVLRDAQIQGMVQNDDRPPSTQVPFMEEGAERMHNLIVGYPNPVHSFTQAEIAHMRNTPVNIYAGTTLGFEIEVMLPADASDNGYIWTPQGGRRPDLDHSIAVAQALRDDGYGQRVIRITRVSDRIEEMQDGNQYVSGELRAAVVTVFPGDASLMQATEEEATEDLQELAAQEQATRAEAVGIEYDGDGFPIQLTEGA